MSAPDQTLDRRRHARPRLRRQRRAEERVHILGAVVDLMRPEEVLNWIAQRVAAGERGVVANHNLHSLALQRRSPELADFFARAELVELDSTPLIAFSRLLGLHSRPFHRSTYLDWRDHFWSLAARQGWRVFYLGGAPGVAATAAERLGERYPGVAIGVRDGYFDMDGADNREVLAEIEAFAPQVLFVGMGMPRQELWIARNLERLPRAAILSVGAAFDYEAGVQSAAPRWMGRMGIEWLYRLARDPRRLFHRYCVEPWALVGPALGDVRRALLARFT